MRWGKVPTVPSSKDYYEILGVDRDADQRTIKRAFLKKAREVRRMFSDDPDAEQKFKEVNEAYSVLSDEQKRSNYDRPERPMAPAVPGTSISAISSAAWAWTTSSPRSLAEAVVRAVAVAPLAGAAATWPSRSPSRSRRPRSDAPRRSRMIVWPPARIVRARACRRRPETTCPRCHGTGYVTTVQRSIFGQMQSSSPCPECHGEGTVIDHPCDMCGGGRAVERSKSTFPPAFLQGSSCACAAMARRGSAVRHPATCS